MRSRLNSIWLLIITFFFLLAIGAALFVRWLNYDVLVSYIVATVNKNGLEEKIRNQVFTRERFMFLQRICWFIFILAPVVYWLAFRYRLLLTGYLKFAVSSLRNLTKSLVAVFSNNSRRQNRSVIAVMTMIVLCFVWHMINSFLTYDEMWSYNYYTANHFYYNFFTYSSYPFFEMSTHLFKWLPFPMKINLRLSPFIFGIATCILFYACLRRYFNNHFTAMAGLASFAFMPLSVFFMVNARGVMHELFFAVAGIFSFLFWLGDTKRKSYLVVYSIAGILGLYSMTTHILFLVFLLVAALFILMKKDRNSALLFIKINLLIFFGFFILYAPMFITTGIAVFSDVAKTSPPFSYVIIHLPYFMRNVFIDFTGNSNATIFIFFASIAAAILLKNKFLPKYQLLLLIAAGLPLSTFLLYIVTGFPFAGRSLAFAGLSVPFIFCLFVHLAEPWLTGKSKFKSITGVVAVVIAIAVNSYFYFPVYPKDKYVSDVSKILIDNKITSCYDNSSNSSKFYYYYPGIEFYYRMQHASIRFAIAQRNSMRYMPLSENDKYDCIVYDSHTQNSNRLPGYYMLYDDPDGKFTIWKRNDFDK